MANIKKVSKILASLAAVSLSIYLSGCASDGRNAKYTPWNMDTTTPVLEPEIAGVKTVMSKKANYQSFLYLFGIYEIDDKYAGFDILYFLDFTKDYKVNNVVYENEESLFDFDFIPSRSKRLKKMVLGDMAMESRSNVIMSPMYKLESQDYLLFQNADCNVTSYGGELQGFKIKGQGYKDAIIPNDKNVDAPFLVKESK